MNLQIAEKRFLQQCAQARMRNIPFTITFDEWLKLWVDSGKWEQRGRRKDQYCMSRIGDKGGYELGNVFIQSQADNVREAQLGKKYTEEQCLVISNRLTGTKLSKDTKLKISRSRMGQNNNPNGYNKLKIKENKLCV